VTENILYLISRYYFAFSRVAEPPLKTNAVLIQQPILIEYIIKQSFFEDTMVG